MSLRRRYLTALVLLALASPAAADDAFVIKPYLQLGEKPEPNVGDLVLLWAGEDTDVAWSVEYRPDEGSAWLPAESKLLRRVAPASVPPHRVYRANLKGLPAGVEFAYRVRKGGEIVFSSPAKSRKAAGQAYRFVAVGDLAQGTPSQRAIAERMTLAKPAFVMVTGDIVSGRGRTSEYRDRYWPAYNADEPSASVGGPLIRSTLTLAAPGNHDVGSRDLGRYPDGLAYFLYWDQPLNGPVDGPYTIPLTGPEANLKAFLDSAGPTYPRMANFSFDYAGAHWLVLDANPYVDWRDPGLRAWVERDLRAAKDATWRFVSFHQPGFNSSKAHFEEQQMRLMANLFEAGQVDLVFNGHVHNYQRSFPLKFVADQGPDGRMVREKNLVAGQWTLDKVFDGQAKTRPDGVIYLVTGAGGAGLYNPEQQDQPATWQTFTDKFVSKVHSLSVVDVDGPTLTVRQVDESGREIDRFTVAK